MPVKVGTYTLSESGGPAGYTASAWSCIGVPAGRQHGHAGARASRPPAPSSTPPSPPRLTLVKQVVNTSGGTAVPTDWTALRATGPVTIQGRVGDASITDAVGRRSGTYTLFESGGPSGYTAVARGPAPARPSTNPATGTVDLWPPATPRPARSPTPTSPRKLTLRKVVDPAASGSGKVASDWTLTATPVAITGQGPVQRQRRPDDGRAASTP